MSEQVLLHTSNAIMSENQSSAMDQPANKDDLVHLEDDDTSISKINNLPDLISNPTDCENDGLLVSQTDSPDDVNQKNKPKTEKLLEGSGTGYCKWFNPKKGYGFIGQDNGGEDIYVYQNAIKKRGFRSLRDNERVKFTFCKSSKGLKAISVTVDDDEMDQKSAKKLFRCFNCNDFATHIASECTAEKAPKKCFLCGEPGHLRAVCPDNLSKRS